MRNLWMFLLLAIPFFGMSQVDTIITQTSYNGVVTFSSFIADVTQGGQYSGSLIDFSDQTNTYFANSTLVGDVVFDNLGQQWYITFVSASTLLTADVHIKAIGFTPSGAPFGRAAIGRLSSTGLFPAPTHNVTGISDQLRARIDIHNGLVVARYMRDSFTVANSVDSIQHVRDTTSLIPSLGDEFVNSTKDTSGVYSTDRWLLRIGGSGSGGAGNIRDTITQTTHGFSVGELVGYYSSQWQAANSTADSTVWRGMVADSITANTFAIQSHGFLKVLSHGKTVGEVYYLQDNGSESINPDVDIQAPTVYVVNDSTYLINPPLSFIASGGGGGSLVDSTRLIQDSILVYYQDGSEVGRDTIALAGGGGGGGGGLSGGTTDRIPYWTSATTQSASGVRWDNTNTRMGIAGLPNTKFDLWGVNFMVGADETGGSSGLEQYEGDTRGTNTAKMFRFFAPSYASATDKIGLLTYYSTSSSNTIHFGGSPGLGLSNPDLMRFYVDGEASVFLAMESSGITMNDSGMANTYFRIRALTDSSSDYVFGVQNLTGTHRLKVRNDGVTIINDVLSLNPISAATASVLSPSDGWIIYVNSTDGTFTSVGIWARENGSWVKL